MKGAAATVYRGEQSSSQYVPYRHHVTDNIISTENNQYIAAFRIQGRSYTTASDNDLIRWHSDLNHLVKQFGSEHVDIWTHLHHRKVDVYQGAKYPSRFAREFDHSYQKRVKAVPTMVNDLYITVVYNPVEDTTQRYLSKMEKYSVEDIQQMREESVDAVEDISAYIMDGMKTYGVERLGVYWRDEEGHVLADDDDDDLDEDDEDVKGDLLADVDYEHEPTRETSARSYAFCSILELLGFLVNGEWEPVPVCQAMIKKYLQSSRTVSSTWGDVLQVRNFDKVSYAVGVEIRAYAAQTEPGQLNQFLSADFEFVLTQTFCCMSEATAKTFLSRQGKSLEETQDYGSEQIGDLKKALNDLVSGKFIMGWHHTTVHVFANTAKKATALGRRAKLMLSSCGVSASSVGLASEAAYYAMLPGNAALIPRPTAITSLNWLCFSSFHNLHTGKPNNNPWGDSVAMLKTTSNSPLFFNFHSTRMNEDSIGKRPAGHTLFLGKTGEGKTTLMNALLTWATKFEPRMFIFDRDRGMQQLVMALGGHYTVMRDGEPSGFQPMQMEPTRANIEFCKRLIRVLAEISRGGTLDANEVEDINAAVEAVMREGSLIAREHRSISSVYQQIPGGHRTNDQSALTLKELLKQWTSEGQYGWLFDNARDSLDLSVNDIVAFDISDFIVEKDEPAPITRLPMMMYMFYRMRQSVDGTRPVLKVFDEFATYLDDPIMAREVRRGLKTDRKKQGVYVFATQEPNDALESLIGKTVVQQVVTKVMLHNPEASHEDYVKGLKLTETEYDLVTGIPEKSFQFLVKQGSMSAMAKFDIRGMEKELAILSGTPDGAEACVKIREEVGDDPDKWLPAYWKKIKVDNEWEVA